MQICQSLIHGKTVASPLPAIDKIYPATGEIVAKIEQGQVIETRVTAEVDGVKLFETLTTKEFNGRQIPTVLSEEIGAQ